MSNLQIKWNQFRSRLDLLLSISKASQHFKTYPPVFIIGAARSGTSLTLKLFKNQPSLTPLFEPCEFWDKAFSRGEDDTYQERLNGLGFQALRYLYYREISPENPYLVVKDPRDSIRIDSLNHLFPNAKFIHLIRDGRDVISSIIKTSENELYHIQEAAWPHVRIPNYKNLLTYPSHIQAAMQWKYCVETSLKQLSQIPQDRQLTFYYEELINHPQKTAEKLLYFVNNQLEINQESLQNTLKSISNQVIKNEENPTINPQLLNQSWKAKMNQFSSLVANDAGSGTTSDTIRMGRWQLDLDQSILSDIEPIIGDTLTKLGYQ